MKFKLACIGLLGVLFLNCSSDDDLVCAEDYTGELTAVESVLQGTWVLTAVESSVAVDLTDDEEDNPIKDIFAQSTDCQNDAEYNFMTDRSFTFKQGLTAANCEQKSDILGTWQFTGNTLNFSSACTIFSSQINLNDDETAFSVESLLNIRDINNQLVEAEVTYTYTKN
ncbi:DUF5004 domain-containing protein [Cellulophaga omnivescoria]|uniref:DUF5004 domain-containing protein n=1 Tax=Cellulophaga omnivescoria TaxID=1888890 RepID=UPI0022F03F6A|nr:DUF5004 domain-containing protein [Cellulophaga omnivescoria]WBU90473.1 DUF5004 domain-containing protein [Cellulophaga omnivescoria]WKB82593.1 DUF5004 domain-containing protein [Cellulophaga lytica]